jgi:hypothetical protein
MSAPAIPDLEFRAPDCPLCLTETTATGDGYDCEHCELTWSSSGDHGYRIDDAEQCTAERHPWVDYPLVKDAPNYAELAKHHYRCLLADGHRLPHRGIRIDRETGQTREWSDADQETAVAV